MSGHTMYKVRFIHKNRKPSYVRYTSEAEARDICARNPDSTKYIGPVTVTASGNFDWREVRCGS